MAKRPWNDPPEWQNDYFGRHVKLFPAVNAQGYPREPPRMPYMAFPDAGMIQRAIPAEGAVTACQGAFTGQVPVPQVDLRMGRQHKWKRAVTRVRRKRLKR